MKNYRQNYTTQMKETSDCSWELDTQLRFVQSAAHGYWCSFGLLADDYCEDDIREIIDAAEIVRKELENATDKAKRVEAELQFLQFAGAA